ncbi:MAG: hypothetical protein K8R68_08075, partial [Bacteroidales bacterium]|nr:hypothetical protein [Bacteroidales bacterium]
MDFLCIPQTYGVYFVEPGHFDDPDQHWGRMRPPSNMQKCLQFLPLCYGADGIIDYKFRSYYNYGSSGEESNEPINGDIGFIPEDTSRDVYHRLALIDEENFPDDDGRTPQYYAIQEANHEIQYIGPITKSLEWINAGTIDTDGEYPEFEPYYQHLGFINVSGNGFYSGFMECGEFVDNDGYPYFMFVNRRTDYSLDDYMLLNGKIVGIPINTDIAFYDPEPQEITFHFTNPMENYYLVDQYSGGIYEITDNVSEILIYPGDGMLLKLCQLPVPQVITGTYSISNCYIPYDVIIQSGGLLYVGDNVEFGPNSQITVSNDGILNMCGNIVFGRNSKITNHGVLFIFTPAGSRPKILDAKFDKWRGIRCVENSVTFVQNNAYIKNAEIGIDGHECEVYIINSTIEDCDLGISMSGDIIFPGACHLEFISSTVIVPPDPDAVGISLFNSGNDHNFLITGTENEKSEIIGTDKIGTGIFLFTQGEGQNSSFLCEHTSFSDLETGISHNPYCRANHEIKNCKFENDDTGIQLFGTGSLYKIEDCEFIDNDYGISQNTVKTRITNCKFDCIDIGIDYANSQQGPISLSMGVYNSYFGYYIGINNEKDIRCSDTSPEVENCIFKSDVGIESVNNSNVNASFDAENVFLCTDAHLVFAPDAQSFSSGILLYRGHNDFYDENDDFRFLSNYNGSEITINADCNWWEDFDVDIDDEFAIEPPIIIADEMDPEPNVPIIVPPIDRFENASYEESLGNNETALDSFKEILNDKLESEKQFWSICIDKVYNLSLMLEEDINALLNYYEILYQTTPEYLTEEERTSLQLILKNYQKKCHIEKNEYQQAADIVIERINDPISTLDSLFAVMQLETIYMLSYSDSTGRGNSVVTSYDKLAPKTLKEHNKKHKDHWDEIYNLLGVGNCDELEQNLPPVPVLSGNYPNPFNPETKIVFSIPEDSKINLSSYNIKGQKVRTLINNNKEKGFHNIIWNSKDNNGKLVASCVYFYKF